MNFSINFDGNAAQQATRTASALEQMYEATQRESRALAIMEKQLKAAGKGGATNVETGRTLSASIDAQKQKIASLTDEMVRAGGSGFEPLKKKSSEYADASEKATGTTNKLLSGLLSLEKAKIVFTVLKSIVGQLGELAGMAARFSEARGDFERGLEAIYGSEEAARHTYDVISTITDRVAVSQEKALEIFDRLEKAGLRNGDTAVRATETIAKAEAARKGAGDALQGVIERASKSRFFSISRDELRAAGLTFKELAKNISANTGTGVKDAELALRAGRVSLGAGLDALNKTVDSKLGKIADKKFLTVGVQFQRLKDNIGRLFSGVDTSRLGAALQRIADLFNENTVAGSLLKNIIEGAFNGIAKAIEVVGPYVEIFFKSMILLALKAYNAFRPLIKSISEAFGGNGAQSFEDTMLEIVGTAGKLFTLMAENIQPIAIAIGTLLVPTVWALASSLVAAGAGMVAATWPALALIGALIGLYKWGGWVVDSFKEIGAYFSDSGSWIQLGKDIITGLLTGLVPGGDLIAKAMGSVAEKGIAAFKKIFGIASPSRVMKVQGKFINQGLEQGLDESSSLPARAMPTAPENVPKLGTGIGGKSGASVSFAPGAIVINCTGETSQEEIRETVTSTFIDLFEQLGLAMAVGS